MKKAEGALLYSPSDLINFMENEFITWMDRYHLEFPGEVQPDEASEEDQVFQKLGYQHEANLLQRFREEGREVVEIQTDRKGWEQTINAMSRGTEIIYQAALRTGQFAGYSDFLVRIDQPSRLGKHGYEVWDTKLARRAKPYFVIQLCSGVVVLPCGAGKTVVGLAAMELVGQTTLVLTTSLTAVKQWRREILDKTTIHPDDIAEYTGERKTPGL